MTPKVSREKLDKALLRRPARRLSNQLLTGTGTVSLDSIRWPLQEVRAVMGMPVILVWSLFLPSSKPIKQENDTMIKVNRILFKILVLTY